MINIGLVGFGYWGENLARNINQSEAKLVGLSELSTTRCEKFSRFYPNITIQPYFELLKNCDAVVIATPPATHFPLAKEALMAGKHVLVEKPMCLTSAHCKELIGEASKRKLTLAVDHTFVHTAAVQKIGAMFAHDELGRLLYYDSARVNLGAFQTDCDVVWDLAVHDLAILEYVAGPYGLAGQVTVSAQAFTHYQGQFADQAFINLEFEDFNAHLNVSWSSPVKIRNVLIAGEKKMIVYDDIEPDEKIKVYDKGVKTEKNRVSYRSGDVFSPKLENKEGLAASIGDFINAIELQQRPLTDGFAGLRVVHLLETISHSAKKNGEVQKIKL